ncbi:MAG: hypothetical protein IPI46_01450 [Bacteroidetes bacterium]|nr:hypothetical protein [Bacteroidota bacterium]
MKFYVIAFLSFCSISIQAKVFTLHEALSQKIISLAITGTPTNENPTKNSHTGKCLKLQFTNTSNLQADIQIENASRFVNGAKSNQDLICTENMLVKLNPKQKNTMLINALCCEKQDGSPSEKDTFLFLEKANPSIQKLCALLEKQKNFGNTAQQAMWCFTDHNAIEQVYDTHPDITIENELAKLIASELKVPVPARTTSTQNRILKYPIEVEGKYTQFVSSPVTIGVYITDTINNILITLFPDETENRTNGTVKYSYAYRGQLPEGKYLLQAKVNNEWKLEKEIRIRANAE